MHLWHNASRPPPNTPLAVFGEEVWAHRTTQGLVFVTALFEVLREAGHALVVVSKEDALEDDRLAETEKLGVHHLIEPYAQARGLRALVDEFDYAAKGGSVAIGGSLNDLDLLAMVETGIAFNPDPALCRTLVQHPRSTMIVRVTECRQVIQITRPVRTFHAQPPLVYEYRVEEIFPRAIAAAIRTRLEARGHYLL